MSLPILYSFRRCPYAMRARMSIIRTGFQVEHREVILRDRPAHMMEISPKGTVPVLLLPDGTVIEESLEIMEYVQSWDLNEEERKFVTDVKIRVLGYLMGEGQSDDRPIVRIDENLVEITYPTERIPRPGDPDFFGS